MVDHQKGNDENCQGFGTALFCGARKKKKEHCELPPIFATAKGSRGSPTTWTPPLCGAATGKSTSSRAAPTGASTPTASPTCGRAPTPGRWQSGGFPPAWTPPSSGTTARHTSSRTAVTGASTTACLALTAPSRPFHGIPASGGSAVPG